MATSFQQYEYDAAPSDSTRARSRFSKALPAPPPPTNSGLASRGKVNPFPTAGRPFPTPIPRRPVGTAPTISAHSREPSGGSVSSLYSLYNDSPVFAPSTPAATFPPKTPSQTLSDKIMSPLPPPPKDDAGREEKTPRLPALPQKDYNIRKAEDGRQTPNQIHSGSISSTNSSPKPEIWKRRSVRSDRSPSISDLKLSKSNGFTSSPPAISQSIPPAEQPLPTLSTQPLQLPRSIGGGLPGRNIRKPVPARPNPEETQEAKPAQPDKAGSMGQKLSTISRKKVGASNALMTTGATMSPITRLPTPEYQKTDKKPQQPITPQVIPPSPETSPSDSIPQPPHAAPSLGLSAGSNPRAVANEPLAQSISRGPSNTSNSSNSSNNSTIKPTTFGIRSASLPQRGQSLQSQTQTHPLPAQSVPRLSDPVPAEPLTSAFPFNTLIQVAPGTIFAPAILSSGHFNCYQSHRSMRMSRNNIYPLACIVCERKDTEKRWMCTWCCLRCCEGCLNTMSSVPRRDLKLALEKIGRTPPRGIAGVS